MVTVGFIVEGDSETKIIKSAAFQTYLVSLGLQSAVELVINAEGKYTIYHPNGELEKLKAITNARLATLYNKGCQVVFFVVDRDGDDACLTEFKSKVHHHPDNVVIVAKQELEAWFLADSQALNTYLNAQLPPVATPEHFECPFDEIRRLCFLYKNRGLNDKTILADNMLLVAFPSPLPLPTLPAPALLIFSENS